METPRKMKADDVRSSKAVELTEPARQADEDIQPDDIQRWAAQFHVSGEQLRNAILRVGPNSTKVKAFLEV